MSQQPAWTASTVAIVGAGSIGVAFAIVFARAGLDEKPGVSNAGYLHRCLSGPWAGIGFRAPELSARPLTGRGSQQSALR